MNKNVKMSSVIIGTIYKNQQQKKKPLGRFIYRWKEGRLPETTRERNFEKDQN